MRSATTAGQEALETARRDHTSVVIVGGGISGLAVARALLDQVAEPLRDSLTLTVLEADDQPGGKIRTEAREDFICEWGPNGFLDREPATLTLTDELDLRGQLQPAASAFGKRYLYRRGRLHAISMHPLRFLGSPLLPVSAKARLLCEPLIPARHYGSSVVQLDESVAAFASRRIGKTAADILIDAMQSGIYAGDPHLLSVQSCFPRVVEVEQQFGSLIRGMIALKRQKKGSSTPGAGPSGHLTSYRRGMQQLTDTLAHQLGSHLQLGQRVASVARHPDGTGFTLHTERGDALAANAVVLACPAYEASRLVQPMDAKLANLTGQIDYAPLAVVCLGYRRDAVSHPLDGFGFLAPHVEGLPILGTLFTSSIFPDRAPEATVLLRVLVGGARDREVATFDDEALVARARDTLGPLVGLQGQPCFTRVFRHDRAIPQYNVGHGKRLAQIEQAIQSHPGLFIAGNAYHGIGVNDCVRNAPAVARAVLAHITQL